MSTGSSIPSVAYGTGRLGSVDSVVGWVKQAISGGFIHIGKVLLLLTSPEGREA